MGPRRSGRSRTRTWDLFLIRASFAGLFEHLWASDVSRSALKYPQIRASRDIFRDTEMPASGSLPVVPGVGPWPAPNRSSWRSGAGQSPSVVRGTPRSGVDGPVERSYMALVWVGRAVTPLAPPRPA